MDNRKPPRWRLLYEGAGALFNISQTSLNFAIGVLAKPQYDLRRRVEVERVSQRDQPVRPRRQRRLQLRPAGRPQQPDQRADGRRSRARAWIRRSAPAWASRRRAGGASAGASASSTTRATTCSIRGARSASAAGAGYTLTALERAIGCRRCRGRRRCCCACSSWRPGTCWPRAAEGSATCGDIQLFSQLPSAGGPLALRGYGADELLARSRAHRPPRAAQRLLDRPRLEPDALHHRARLRRDAVRGRRRDRDVRDLRVLARARLLRRRLQLPRAARRVRPPPAVAVDRLRRAAQPPRRPTRRASACRAPPPTARRSSSWSASSRASSTGVPVRDERGLRLRSTDPRRAVPTPVARPRPRAPRRRAACARTPPSASRNVAAIAIASDRCAAIRRGRGSSPAATSASAASTTTASGASAHAPGQVQQPPEPVRRVALADQRERQIEDRVVERLRVVRVKRARNHVQHHRRDQQPDGQRRRPPRRSPRRGHSLSSGNSRNGATVVM